VVCPVRHLGLSAKGFFNAYTMNIEGTAYQIIAEGLGLVQDKESPQIWLNPKNQERYIITPFGFAPVVVESWENMKRSLQKHYTEIILDKDRALGVRNKRIESLLNVIHKLEKQNYG
jgi:hypothetical protein